MGDTLEPIDKKLSAFRKRYYFDLALRGVALTATILFLYFLLAIILESSLWLDSVSRLSLVIIFVLLSCGCIYFFLRKAIRFWINKKGISDEQSAKFVGDHLPNVKDRLLNLIQLSNSSNPSPLAQASIHQKSKELAPVSFQSVVDLRRNKKYLNYLAFPAGILIMIFLINASIITDSTKRIIHFQQEFAPKAPFDFHLLNRTMTAFYNEDFTVRLKLSGIALPDDAYLTTNSRKLKLNRSADGEFTHIFENLQEGMTFQIEAAGFYSNPYTIRLVNRPEVVQFKVALDYPQYLEKKSEVLSNASNLEIPEGTRVKWILKTAYAQNAGLFLNSLGALKPTQSSDNQTFTFESRFVKPDAYEIVLQNAYSKNKERMAYRVDVIKDEFPKISITNLEDSVFYSGVVLGGSVSDDYGITQLKVHYKISDGHRELIKDGSFPIHLNGQQNQQSFFHQWNLDSLALKPGENIEYYLEVWDNDGVNGRKSTKSSTYNFAIPDKKELLSEISRSSSQAANKFEQGVNKANELKEEIDEMSKSLKGKQSLDWQDRKKMEDILEKRKNLNDVINDLKKQNDLLNKKKEAFTSEQNERIKERAEQIKKLMDNLLDEKTKKLLEELDKLLKENADISQMRDLMEQLNRNSNVLEKDMERLLELYKQLDFDFKQDQLTKQLEDAIKRQQELAEETRQLEEQQKDNQPNDRDERRQEREEKRNNKENAQNNEQNQNNNKEADQNNKDNQDQNNKNSEDQKSQEEQSKEENSKQNPDNQDLAKDQNELSQTTEDIKKALEELKEMAKELEQEDSQMPSEEQMQNVQDSQNESEQNLQQNNPSKSKQAQERAIQQMQQAQQQMQDSQNSMEMEVDMQNLESLRQILHGLIKLSFDQEDLTKGYDELQQNDPRFNQIAQEELKLKSDSEILSDSLLALGKKDPFLGPFITEKVTDLNEHLDKTIDAFHGRYRPQALTEMQSSMEAINNLALMLDDHYDQMMQMMAQAQQKKGGKGKPKKGGQGRPNLSQMQRQLNEQIRQLKNSGKSGRELSEELAKLAAQQERIRRALQDYQKDLQQRGLGQAPGQELPSQMEETETDLVNKQLTDEMIKRQRDIETRLLDAENAMREQEMDEERKGETAKEDYEKNTPRAFEEYLRLKEKEIELLRTVPPKLEPFYKKEVNEYFKRINEQD